MGQPILIYGESGSGKSRSLKNFAEDEIFLINVEGKFLPFKKHFKYVMCSKSYQTIESQLKKMPTKIAVIDDAGYLLTTQYMSGHSTGARGSAVFDLFNELADNYWGLIQFIKSQLPDDVIVYIMMHEEVNDYGKVKLHTIGKLLEDKVKLEGMVTIALRCMSKDGKHFFRTVTDGNDITKSPEDMFEFDEIDNDLKMVDETIRNYYNLEVKTND